jgi:hypothetical protein
METAMDHFTCPECGRGVPTPAQPLPVRVECPHCHEIVLVPRQLRAPRQPHGNVDPADSGLLLWLGDGLSSTSRAAVVGDPDTARR